MLLAAMPVTSCSWTLDKSGEKDGTRGCSGKFRVFRAGKAASPDPAKPFELSKASAI